MINAGLKRFWTDLRDALLVIVRQFERDRSDVARLLILHAS